ncbi:PREDICTED: mucin-like protein [Amphimedon queenslandica]|uniref:EGF-like domain-containing protein n=1 Tax=Amphimedon queenslandica TaxID=400682 RepID=A0AAN0JMM3_AMPQE|nr:PREDICTED: mucin-like protein [Amphimedon queenslandica]|eukprot:XP_019858254.1 PREDICTED: mucin-like protein [Amphimedon queenslandica]
MIKLTDIAEIIIKNLSSVLYPIVTNTPPVIEARDTFMITVGEKALYTLRITDPGDTISVTIEFDGGFPYTLDQNGSIWTLNVTLSSLVEFNFTVIAADSFNATSKITPQVIICSCTSDRGNCTIDEYENNTSNPLILMCDCMKAYEGEYCEDDFDGCTEVSCFNDATCTDVPAPGTGATCPPCPSGYTGDGIICHRSVSYQTFSSDNPLANDVFNDVNSFIRTSKNITSYKGMWMLVMEWKDVHPYPHGSYYYYYYYYYNQILEKHNTFQAILTTDGSDTHIIYTYKCGDIMWDNYYSRSVVGYNIARGRYENHRGSGIPGELLKLGCYDDMNKAAKYTNIVYSFQSDKKDPNVAICLERYRNDLELSAISSSFAIPCPCSACFTFPSWGALLVNGPYSSHVFRYNPFFNYLNYAKYDEEFYSKCCTRTQNCELFRERRPIKTCAGYIPPRRTWFWGDPHINTLDGATYTFNGLGEYVLLRTINADFEIQARQVQSDQESLFTYAPERTYASYSNPNHVPVFLDQIDPETRAEAERICGGSNKIECIFDYSQTKNEELALDTQTTMEQNELNKQIGNNLPPVIEASDTFMLTVGETALYTTNITDPGDTISVTFDGEFPYTLDQDGSIWTLNVTHFSLVEFSFTVIASDSFNATSVLTPQVRICGCPADRGSCTVEGVQNASSNPLILICNCIEAYNGKYCEDDYDGCTEVSCFNDATCTDVPAPGTGATCPPCPSGYTGDGLICDDIDECNSTSTSNCSHFCNNTIGSYQCTCMPGYELHSDGRSCNEINECEKLLDNCQQECMNTDGSFSCSCYDGFLLQDDGRSCQNDPNRECLDHSMCEQFCVYDNYTKTKNCSCQSGYDLSTNMANCTDIDECSETNPCTQICINTIGSFECNCSDGFQLQSDGFTCTDIDECLVLGSCPEPRIRCVNSPGSFDCFCPLGTIFQDGSCKVLVEPVPSLSASSKSSAYSSTVNSSPVMSTYFGSFTNSPSSLLAVSSPSVTPTPTLPENSGVIVVLSGTNKSNFDIESFKNVTAEALNDYCITNDCTSVSSEKRKRVAVNNLIEANDIVITEITETINGLRVKFYIKGQSGAPFDANAVVAALKAADSKYSSAGFTIAGVTILNSHSSTIVVTTTASVTPIPVVQIIGITIVVVIGILIIMIIIISILWFIRQSDKKKSQGDSSGVILEKELNKEDKETIL